MDLHGRKSVQRLTDCFVGHLHGLVDGFALDQLRCHAAGCNGGSAAEGLELHVPDDLVLVDIQVNAHDIAALGISHSAHAAGIFNFSYISGVLKMVHYFLCIHNSISCILVFVSGRGPLSGGRPAPAALLSVGRPRRPWRCYPGMPHRPWRCYSGMPRRPWRCYPGMPRRPWRCYPGMPRHPWRCYPGMPRRP